MAELFVEVYKLRDEEAEAPVQTALCLYIFTYLRAPTNVSLTLVLTDSPGPSLTVKLGALSYKTVDSTSLESPVSDCCLPVFRSADSKSCVAGLCAVLRQVIKHSGDEWRHLLGFREGCLFACAEVSLWTKFCEIDAVEVVNNILTGKNTNTLEVKVPEHLARFEEHLKQPVRAHNVDKLRRQNNQDAVNHDFAEGYTMSLADLIIALCVRVFLQAISDVLISQYLPSVSKWFHLVLQQDYVAEALSIVQEVPPLVNEVTEFMVPEVARHSLYKSDPTRYKPKWKQYTRQEEVEHVIGLLRDLDLQLVYDSLPFGHEMPLDWHTVPEKVQPDVPPSRLERKRHQLQNLSKAVIKIAKPGNRIVDFCCGSGHLGIVVAHSLPQCEVVLLDNKEESLARAKARVAQLALTNVTVVQCNLDYFKGEFQIGMSLHACGVATDLVIHTCLQRNAAFVVCPCCYGSLQNNHMIHYPQSTELAHLTLRQYLVLGHCADQTHKQLYSKSEQGEQCMWIVDHDRCLLARSRGYSVSLAKLIPTSCSPKNNLLVGIPQHLAPT